MRSIIFTSACLLACLLASAAAAQDGPPPGCFQRSYTAAHLEAHPEQVVQAMSLRIYDEMFDGRSSRYAALVVDFADQGHVARAGLGGSRLDQALICFGTGRDAAGCAVECDGGAFTVVAQSASDLTIATNYLLVGDTEGCGGALDLAERPRQEVRYRLTKMTEADCLSREEK